MKTFAQQLAFYSVYHENKTNIWIHIIGVPIIAYGLLMALSFIDFGVTIGKIHITLATVYLALIIGYFFIADKFFATIGLVFYGIIYILADQSVHGGFFDQKTAIIVSASAFFGAFALQFVGHGVFEKKRPALVDNLFQAFMSAPFFIIVDVFFLLGLKKELQVQMSEAVKANPELSKISTI